MLTAFKVDDDGCASKSNMFQTIFKEHVSRCKFHVSDEWWTLWKLFDLLMYDVTTFTFVCKSYKMGHHVIISHFKWPTNIGYPGLRYL